MRLRSNTILARQLRRDATEIERRVWYALRESFPDRRSRRQHPVGRYIVDFACPERKLAIELDGGHHNEQKEADALRAVEIAHYRYRMLRFWNNEVNENIEGVLSSIAEALTQPPPHPNPLRPRGRRGRRKWWP